MFSHVYLQLCGRKSMAWIWNFDFWTNGTRARGLERPRREDGAPRRGKFRGGRREPRRTASHELDVVRRVEPTESRLRTVVSAFIDVAWFAAQLWTLRQDWHFIELGWFAVIPMVNLVPLGAVDVFADPDLQTSFTLTLNNGVRAPEICP